MTFDLQTLLTLAIVAAAAIYLARAGWRTIRVRKGGGCGTCGNCEAGKTVDGKPAATLISVDRLVDSARRKN